MNHSAPRKALRIFGIVLVILLPVLLALWFAQIRAKAETGDQLRLFSRLALQKTELVIREADEARDKARLYQGEICSPQHQQYLLGIVRGLLYIDDLIYANGTHFFCSTTVRRPTGWRIPAATYTKKPDIAIYYYRETPFYPDYAMNYMQRGNYVVVVNPLSYSALITSDRNLAWGVLTPKPGSFFPSARMPTPLSCIV